jgi:hypothetical protein
MCSLQNTNSLRDHSGGWAQLLNYKDEREVWMMEEAFVNIMDGKFTITIDEFVPYYDSIAPHYPKIATTLINPVTKFIKVSPRIPAKPAQLVKYQADISHNLAHLPIGYSEYECHIEYYDYDVSQPLLHTGWYHRATGHG